MTNECAFCPDTANISGEHLWSDWMNKIVPGEKIFAIKNESRQIIANWTGPELNWKANVVCEACNNGWMSSLESQHAMPSMSDLIIGKVDIPIDQVRANSIALFGFKTAVVIDHIERNRQPFFERSIRHEFRHSLTIPYNVSMWLTGFASRGRGEINTLYRKGEIAAGKEIEVYTCTYAVEHLVIQVVSYKETGIQRAVSIGDEFLTVPFWPKIPDAFIWPPSRVLNNTSDFDRFSDRWKDFIVTC